MSTPTTTERIGDWMQTRSGIRFYPFDPRPEEVHIEDIAAALSKMCRFNGHCVRYYSVAEHSVRVSRICDPQDALWGLLHDAAEAYVGDMIRPIKRHQQLGAYREIEYEVMEAIIERFGLVNHGIWAHEMPYSVREADEVMLATEARDLMDVRDWDSYSELVVKALPEPVVGWSPADAEQQFLRRFHELTEGA